MRRKNRKFRLEERKKKKAEAGGKKEKKKAEAGGKECQLEPIKQFYLHPSQLT